MPLDLMRACSAYGGPAAGNSQAWWNGFRLMEVVPILGTHWCYPGESGRSQARARHVRPFQAGFALFALLWFSMAFKASRSSRDRWKKASRSRISSFPASSHLNSRPEHQFYRHVPKMWILRQFRALPNHVPDQSKRSSRKPSRNSRKADNQNPG